MNSRGKEEDKNDLDSIPMINPDAILRNRTSQPFSSFENINNAAATKKKSPAKLNFYQRILVHPKVSERIKSLDMWWLQTQNRYPFLAGDKFSSDSKYNKRIPFKLHATLDFIERRKLALILTVVGSIVVFVLWCMLNASIEKSVQIHLLEHAEHHNARILKFSTLDETYFPTKNAQFDEWATTAEHLEFSTDEFEAHSFNSPVFFSARTLNHDNNNSRYRIDMDDIRSAFSDKCDDPKECVCMSLMQVGIPRNAVYVYDVAIQGYTLLFDPKIEESANTEYTDISWTLDDTLAPAKKHTVIISGPKTFKVTFKDRKHAGKRTNKIQMSTAPAACLYLQLQLKSNYSALLKTVKEQLA